MLDRLLASLQPDIDAALVSLLGTPATPIIRIADRAMFAPGSAIVQPASLPLLERIAAALRNESGSLQVIDYTDNQPIRTVQFPSNFQLSAARANAVRAIVARQCRRSGAGQRGGPRRCGPDRAQYHRRGPRAEPADRDRAAPPGLTARVKPVDRHALISRWGISFVGTALLAGLAWFFAPLLPGFEDWLPRLAIIVAFAAGLGRRPTRCSTCAAAAATRR